MDSDSRPAAHVILSGGLGDAACAALEGAGFATTRLPGPVRSLASGQRSPGVVVADEGTAELFLRAMRHNPAFDPEPAEAVEAPSPALIDSLKKFDHDVRSPLCAIALNVYLLSGQLAADADPRARDRVRSIGESVKRLQEMVDRLQQLQRGQSLAIG